MPMEMAAEKTTYRSLLRDRNYALVWTGQVTSQVGDSFYEIGLVWLALLLTHQNYSTVGVIIFARLIPYVVFGPVSGVYVDRWNRRRVMIAADTLRGLVVMLVPLLYALSALTVWDLAVVAFLLTTLRTFFNPALQASLPQIVGKDSLPRANGLLQGALQTATVFGPAAAGLILVVAPASTLFLADGLTFFVSAASIMFVAFAATDPRPKESRPTILADLGGTVRELRDNPPVLWTITLFALGLFAVAGCYRVGMPALAEHVYHGGSKMYGLLMSTIGVGTAVGALIVGRVTTRNVIAAIFCGWILWGLCFGLLGFGRFVVVGLLLAVVAGMAESAVTVLTVTLVQQTMPGDQLGRIFSLWSAMCSSGESASGLVVGTALDSFSTTVVFAASGLVTVAVGLAGLLIGLLRPERSASTGADESAVTAATPPTQRPG